MKRCYIQQQKQHPKSLKTSYKIYLSQKLLHTLHRVLVVYATHAHVHSSYFVVHGSRAQPSGPVSREKKSRIATHYGNFPQ